MKRTYTKKHLLKDLSKARKTLLGSEAPIIVKVNAVVSEYQCDFEVAWDLQTPEGMQLNGICDCSGDKPRIVLNRSVMAVASDAERYNCVSHELAHAIVYLATESLEHDERWRLVHLWMGGNGQITNKYGA